jgi:hypothetical protein
MPHDSRTEITQLLFELYRRMDEHRFDDLGELFTAAAEGRTPGGLSVGRDALVAQARRSHEHIPQLQHRVTNVLIDVADDDTAELRALVEAVFADADGVPHYRIGEVYRARVELVDATWRVARFEMTPQWTEGARPVDGRLAPA